MPFKEQQSHDEQLRMSAPGSANTPDEPSSYADDRTGEQPDDPAVDRTRAEFHEPPPQPTVFGAGTVGGAVAASALASGDPADERDPREEDTVRPKDGVTDDHPAARSNQPPPGGARL